MILMLVRAAQYLSVRSCFSAELTPSSRPGVAAENALVLPCAASRYCAIALTVACRSVLLPARCFTRTVSLGSHHLTP